MSHFLRSYQTKGEADIFQQWKDGKKSIMFQLVTGGGKTVLFVNIIKKFMRAGKRVVLVAHREELIKQAWDTLYKNEIMAGIIKSGIPENFHMPCQVASIQTICRRSKLPKADLVIFDEAHHSQDDNSYGDVLLKHWPYARVLGVTATPYRLGGKGFTSLFDTLVQGPPFKSIVDQGYLVPFKYFVSYNPDLSNAKVARGDYVADDISKAMQLAPIVESYLEHCKGKSGICFAVNIHHSNLIVRQYIERGIPAAHVDANTDITVRRKMFQDLRDKKILVLVNVGIATEGTDIPNIDFVQLARPTKSLALFLQMVGRVTRPLWESIQHGNNDEERRALIASSGKPFGIVLDNAGLYLEHGLPDQVFDWHAHFIGYDKRAKKKPDLIEIIEFVAEDENGNTFTSRLPKEVEGLKLIEVNYIEKQKIINLTSLKEFDKNLEIFKRLPHVNKVGFIAYKNYYDYCRKNSLMMSEEVWAYLNKRLIQEPAQERIKLSKDFETSCRIITDNNERDIAQKMIEQAKNLHEGRIKKIERVSVPASFLRDERERYYQENKTPISA
jgi:superfamily II DNA or RNA helicase